MDHKLYYQDAYIKSFSANVITQSQDEGGDWYVILDQTAFYPTGGGQPSDTGTLNDCKVSKVEEVDGQIRHYLDKKIGGGSIEGKIDWNRRFDHMQQHAGQHILSAAFAELTGYETVSFHLGKELLTIDLDAEELTKKEVEEVEWLANHIIIENRPIDTKWATEEEILQYPLRKQLSVTENIRLVIIPKFDYNGCGGTHPTSTGQVSSLKILDWERQKGRLRVHFVCGDRVRKQLNQKNAVLKEVGQKMSSSESMIVETIQKLVERNGELDKEIGELKVQLLQFEAQELVKANQEDLIITNIFQHRTIKELQKLARHITEANKEVIALLVTENEDLLQLVFARGKNSNSNMNKLIKEVLPLINGKGGGSESLAQGGGQKNVNGEEIIKYALNTLRK
jgi:alanyl-tRNA synthetase